jgi:hypothetical protein
VTSTIGHLDLLIDLGLRLLTAFDGRPESSGYHLDTKQTNNIDVITKASLPKDTKDKVVRLYIVKVLLDI